MNYRVNRHCLPNQKQILIRGVRVVILLALLFQHLQKKE